MQKLKKISLAHAPTADA